MRGVLARVGRVAALRRGLVVASAMLLVAMIVLALSRDKANMSGPWWAAFTAFGTLWFVARAATGKVAETRADRLDERELMLRYRTSRVGWSCLVVAGFAVALYLGIVAEDAVLVARGGALLLSVVIGGAAVPTMLLCWARPEPDLEDD